MRKEEIQICIECGTEDEPHNSICAGEKLLELMEKIIIEKSLQDRLSVRAVACLGNCDQRCRLAAISNYRWSWVLGDIQPDSDYAFLSKFVGQWTGAQNGLIPKKERSEELIDKTLGRNPPII